MSRMKRPMMAGIILAILLVLCLGEPAQAQGITKLTPETVAQFDAYIKDGERLLQRRIDGERPFLWADDLPERRLTLRRGDILVEGLPETPDIEGGLLHVWLGAMFIPEATGPEVLAVLQDYDRHQEWYPEPVESKLLSQDGDVYRGYLKLRRKKVITVVLSTEHEAHYSQVSDNRWYGRSYSTKIAEVKDWDTPKEKELPVGEDHGFLWRLYAYWFIEEAEDGVFVESVSVSLSRRIPFGLGWIVKPFVTSLPRESLEGMLQATRVAVKELQQGQ
ncbi:MAG: hypothetical protein E2P05_00145 [Acidobacteria bacterium]|nr:MAG: hypothetical protein E2P05_00145 [Acidobacteriota bacterium]